jgi:iron complex outermembrane receptor protein
MRKMGLLGASIGVIAALAGAPAQAQAQPAADARPNAREPEEIVITARKTEESLQDVPLSVTAFTAGTIERGGLDDMKDVAQLTPGLTFDSIVAGIFGTPIIRGLTQSSILGSRNVATFIDGTYISDSAAVDIGTIGLERVEVVKGPQSALYGRNAFTGAINYVTKRPTNDFDASFSADFGSDSRLRLVGQASGPLIPDLLSARIAVSMDQFDGTLSSPNGVRFNGWDKAGINGAAVFTPTSTTTISGRYFFSDDQLDTPAVAHLPSNTNLFNCGPNPFPTGPNRWFCGVAPEADEIVIESSASPYLIGTERELKLWSITAEQDIGE